MNFIIKEKKGLFEITTAAAFLAFSRANSDLLILETGLGGRFDATNIIYNSIQMYHSYLWTYELSWIKYKSYSQREVCTQEVKRVIFSKQKIMLNH